MRRRGAQWRLILVYLAAVPAAGQSPLTDSFRDPEGRFLAAVEWTTREVTATGRARWQAGRPRAFLERAARVDAYRNLAAAARQARLTRDRRVDDLAGADDEFRRYLSAYIQFAEFGALRQVDQWAEIDARVPLFGVRPAEGETLLGTKLYRRPDIWADEVLPGPTQTEFSGLLLDARETDLPGAFAARIVDDTGRVVWHVECADRALAEEAGAIEYRADWTTEPTRAGARPLVVRVLRTDGPDAIVSVSDGRRIAPDRQAGWPVWCVAPWGTIRTITPVSPFHRVACVSTARKTEAR